MRAMAPCPALSEQPCRSWSGSVAEVHTDTLQVAAGHFLYECQRLREENLGIQITSYVIPFIKQVASVDGNRKANFNPFHKVLLSTGTLELFFTQCLLHISHCRSS